MTETLDCKGLKCPQPVLKIAIKARSLDKGTTLEVQADCTTFADDVKKWCQDAGYVTARTIDPGWVSPGADLLALPNFGISDNAGLSKAMVQSSGLWDVIKQFVTSLRKHSCKVFRPRLTKCTGGEI